VKKEKKCTTEEGGGIGSKPKAAFKDKKSRKRKKLPGPQRGKKRGTSCAV